jgi:hypothetical protein
MCGKIYILVEIAFVKQKKIYIDIIGKKFPVFSFFTIIKKKNETDVFIILFPFFTIRFLPQTSSCASHDTIVPLRRR